MYTRSPHVGGQRSLINPPTFIEYKDARFLIVDAPSNNNLPLYIEVWQLHIHVWDVVSTLLVVHLGIHSVERYRCSALLLCNLFSCTIEGTRYPSPWLGFWRWWSTSYTYCRCMAQLDWWKIWKYNIWYHHYNNSCFFFNTCMHCNTLCRWFRKVMQCLFERESCIHSVLYRAPVLVAIALIELGMPALDAVAYIRERRRGAINNKQLKYIEGYKRRTKNKCIIC